MKTLSKILFLILIATVAGCELADLDEAETATQSGPVLPSSVPSDGATFNSFFHANDQITWQAISFTIASMDGLQNCRLDDAIIISADGTFIYDGGDTLCGAEDNASQKTGTWEVDLDLEEIKFKEGLVTYSAKLEALVQDTLVVSGNYLGFSIEGVYVSSLN